MMKHANSPNQHADNAEERPERNHCGFGGFLGCLGLAAPLGSHQHEQSALYSRSKLVSRRELKRVRLRSWVLAYKISFVGPSLQNHCGLLAAGKQV